ncbi:LysR family transcriptional regulator [Virgisporangium aliadipatigenens]|uniref:LysR family transcriptional regulator n=1 Tax=Virgisporangium aliadipatigenens TaxID=741659 RepID=A0A8J4DND8_9ACTN|nr:LysR family transcriptional regulator [Virgisporangium aliadipatigenens]GIJ43721.1 LysR family transcriptional regulator [Virgisporangium aliadipatigenens]
MGFDRVLGNLDLNLLVTLDALLRERNVTRAAEQLGSSQPAVSAALARLRRHFGDELLHRAGNRYELTPLAVQLAVRTAPALAGVRRVFDTSSQFDPSTVEREFTVVVSDYAAAVLGPVAARLMSERAPGARLRLQQTTPHAVDHADETLRATDGLVLPHGFLADIPHTDLYEDRWVCVVATDSPAASADLTLGQLADLAWVALYHRPTAFAPALQQLRMLGVEPRVEIVVDNFLPMPFLVAGTDRVALMQERLARRVADAAGIRVMACPFEAVPVAEAFWWHPMYRADPAHVWLRELFAEAGRTLDPDAGVSGTLMTGIGG